MTSDVTASRLFSEKELWAGRLRGNRQDGLSNRMIELHRIFVFLNAFIPSNPTLSQMNCLVPSVRLQLILGGLCFSNYSIDWPCLNFLLIWTGWHWFNHASSTSRINYFSFRIINSVRMISDCTCSSFLIVAQTRLLDWMRMRNSSSPDNHYNPTWFASWIICIRCLDLRASEVRIVL